MKALFATAALILLAGPALAQQQITLPAKDQLTCADMAQAVAAHPEHAHPLTAQIVAEITQAYAQEHGIEVSQDDFARINDSINTGCADAPDAKIMDLVAQGLKNE